MNCVKQRSDQESFDLTELVERVTGSFLLHIAFLQLGVCWIHQP